MKDIEIVILIGAMLISGFVGSYITDDMYQNEINSLTHRIDELNIELYEQKCPITIVEYKSVWDESIWDDFTKSLAYLKLHNLNLSDINSTHFYTEWNMELTK